MDDRERLLRDLERYRRLLGYTTGVRAATLPQSTIRRISSRDRAE
jgi:hypothetical protein